MASNDFVCVFFPMRIYLSNSKADGFSKGTRGQSAPQSRRTSLFFVLSLQSGSISEELDKSGPRGKTDRFCDFYRYMEKNVPTRSNTEASKKCR